MKKSILTYLFLGLVLLFVGCQPKPVANVVVDTEACKNEVSNQFNQLIATVNQKDFTAWSYLISQNSFVSAVIGMDIFDDRSKFMESMAGNFNYREKQSLVPYDVKISVLSAELALVTSKNKAEMVLKTGENLKFIHIYTLVWKKEITGWKVIHANETWMQD